MKGLVPEELPKRLPLAGPDEKWGEKWGVEVKSGGGEWGVGVGEDSPKPGRRVIREKGAF